MTSCSFLNLNKVQIYSDPPMHSLIQTEVTNKYTRLDFHGMWIVFPFQFQQAVIFRPPMHPDSNLENCTK